MPFIFRRLAETIGVSTILSLIFSSPFILGILKQEVGPIAIAMFFCILLNLYFLFFFLKGYLLSVNNIGIYFAVNYLVLLVLCIGAISLAAFDVEPLYTLFFFPFRFLTLFGVEKTTSAVVSSILLFIYVAVAPYFMIMPPPNAED